MNWIVCSHPHHMCVEETLPYQRTSHPLPTAFLILCVHVHQCHSPPPTWLLMFGCPGQIQDDDVYCLTYFEVVTSVGHWRLFSWPIAADHEIDCNDNDDFDNGDEDDGVQVLMMVMMMKAFQRSQMTRSLADPPNVGSALVTGVACRS